MILGISGPNGAGKGEVVRYLVERSFYALSLSDVIRDELASRGLSETRERMIETGNALREAHGPGVLAERLLKKVLADRNYVIDSVRNPAEVAALRAAGARFRLIWVDADIHLRFERMRERARPGDPETVEQLIALEGRERASDNPAAQQLNKIQEMSDHTILNDGSLDGLHEKLQGLLTSMMRFERPNWDEYFMSIARVVASRSNCVKRKVAAVVVKDRRIISTGYNGTPRGVRNCNEGGCPRCNAFGKSGVGLDECLCSHGEENAIVQAAYHGTSLRGATIYTTMSPCLFCTKLILNSGIVEVVYNSHYPLGDVPLALLREADIVVRQVVFAAD